MSKPYHKKPLTFEGQLTQLQDRGLTVNDPKVALSTLSHISYYRLSAYWHPHRKRDGSGVVLDDFISNASFEEVLARYEFDRKLRLLILDAIERIEVSLRTQITYHLAHQYGAYGHTFSTNFHPQFKHQEWLKELEQKEAVRSQEEFIRHFKDAYEGFPRLPVWMATEVMSFGLLSKLFKGLASNDQKAIAKIYAIHPKALADWLHVLTYVRNICAHHGRLWNRKLAIRPSLKGLGKDWMSPQPLDNDKLFIVILIMNQLLKINNNDTDWRKNFEALMLPITKNTRLCKSMGFLEDWEKHKLWATKATH
jgi:abortive infection bacteriophage resistance protein